MRLWILVKGIYNINLFRSESIVSMESVSLRLKSPPFDFNPSPPALSQRRGGRYPFTKIGRFSLVVTVILPVRLRAEATELWAGGEGEESHVALKI